MHFDFSFELKKGHLFRLAVSSNNFLIAMQPLMNINLIGTDLCRDLEDAISVIDVDALALGTN